MTSPTEPQAAPDDTPRHLGAPVGGGQMSPPVAQGAIARILQRIDDTELRERLSEHRGGQFARAVAGEIDDLYAAIANRDTQGRAPTLMTDAEAEALERWLHQHFSVAGHTPQPNERLVNHVMMVLVGMFTQVQELQRALSERQSSGTPIG